MNSGRRQREGSWMHLKPLRESILTQEAPSPWLEVENASLFFIPNQRYLKFPGLVILNLFQDLTKLDQWVRC